MKKYFFATIAFAVIFLSATSSPSSLTCAVADMYAVPGGEAVGIKLYTKGLLVVGLSPSPSPASAAGIRRGDIILTANGNELSDTSQLFDAVIHSESIALECIRGTSHYSAVVVPDSSSGAPRIGAWVRDSTAGLGTVTFYIDSKFAALGHAVTDVDTGKIMSVADGTVTGADIVGVCTGKRGSPGELIGTFAENTIGKIDLNCEDGLYGSLTTIPEKEPLKIADRSEACEGEAYIMASIGTGGVEKYTVEIEKINLYAYSKPIVFKVTDKRLLASTGGIVQGMSGSPIIQNNMIIGAVTHVFVNDPTRGYAIFAESMLSHCGD